MTSTLATIRTLSPKQRHFLLAQVWRRYRHVLSTLPASAVVTVSQHPHRLLHTEAGVAAAKAGAPNLKLAAVALVSGMLALGSTWYPLHQKDDDSDKAHLVKSSSTSQNDKSNNTTATTTTVDAPKLSMSTTIPASTETTTTTSAPSPAPAVVACAPQRTRTTLDARPRNAMVSSRKSLKGRGLYDKYNVDWETVLGEGAYGSVHPARLAATGEKVALKRISKRYTNVSSFQTETEALFRIFDNGGHPNISGLRDMYDDHNYYYLILDLVTGGEMLDHLIENGAYSEADAARLMHEVASALAFLHGVGVIHCDLKPENLLLSTKNRLDGTIKIIDFGCAILEDLDPNPSDPAQDFVGANNKSANSTGTTAYWPPERFHDGVFATPAMDMWSVGVILYIMLTGCHPFDLQGISTDEETEQAIRECNGPPLEKELVGHLSDSAIDLIKRLMAVNPDDRITAYEMLHHPWVRGETALTDKMQDSDKKLSRFREARNNLEAGMFAVLLSQSQTDSRISEAKVQRKTSLNDQMSVGILKRAFDVFDAAGKGYINVDDLGRVTKEKTGSAVSSVELEEVLATQKGEGGNDRLDVPSPGISLSQFSKLFSGLRHKHFPRGHYIFHAGDRGDAMYFISSGKVEIQTRKGQLVSLLRSGDFFGEGTLLEEGKTRFTSAKCATPVDVIEISRADFERYIGASITARRDVNVKWRARSLQYAKNLLRLQKNVEVKTYTKGEEIYREGEIGKSMFRVDDDCVLDVSHGGKVVHQYGSGDSFGESSLLFQRPRSSTVTCASDSCRLYEMKGEDFLALVESNPEMAQSLRDMSRKRLLKRAVKNYSLSLKRGTTNEDLIAAFHDADVDKSGSLSLEELRRLMHKMDPNFPDDEIRAILRFVDVDNDGQVTLLEFKRLFRQFEDEVEKSEGK